MARRKDVKSMIDQKKLHVLVEWKPVSEFNGNSSHCTMYLVALKDGSVLTARYVTDIHAFTGEIVTGFFTGYNHEFQVYTDQVEPEYWMTMVPAPMG